MSDLVQGALILLRRRRRTKRISMVVDDIKLCPMNDLQTTRLCPKINLGTTKLWIIIALVSSSL